MDVIYPMYMLIFFLHGCVRRVQSVTGLQFIEEPNSVVKAVNSSLWWPCKAVGTGTLKYSWRFRDAFLAPSSSNHTIFTNGTLYIGNITNSNIGLYQCQVEDSFQKIFSRYVTLSKAYMAEKFQEMPKSGTTFAGNELKLYCAIDSSPVATITWELDRQPVKNGVVSMVTSKRSQLTIKNVDYNNAGSYRCLAKNKPLLALKYSAEAVISVEGRPFLKVPPEPSTGVVGSSVMLHCLAIGVPKPLVEWSLQDSSQKLQNSSHYLLYPNGSIVILNLQSQDEGFYMCEARNTWGRNTKTVFLGVQGYHGKPVISYTSSNASILLGHDVTLRCRASGNPTPTISWTKDHSSGLPMNRSSLPSSGELVIRRVQHTDSGTYVCTATNSKGSSSKHVGLNVYSPPSFTVKPLDTQVNEGKRISMNCQATSLPKGPVLAWKTPNSGTFTPFNSSGADNITVLSNGTLTITYASAVHTGKYRCSTKNQVATLVADAFLTVFIKPVLTHKPTDQKVAEGSSPLIPCSTKGYPSPVVTWSLFSQTSETPIISGGVFTIHSNGSLSISHVKKRHSGTYKCVAQNTVGSIQGLMTLSVLVAPVFLVTPQHTILKLGESVTLHCSARGEPAPSVSWSRGGKPLILDSNMVIQANHSLSISRVSEKQLGEYTCVASNNLLSVRATGSIQVKDVPDLTAQPSNTTANVGAVTALPCHAIARETPMYLWYTSDSSGTRGRLLQPGISHQGQGSTAVIMSNGTLTIKSTQQVDEGWYLCVVKNSAGEKESKAYLNVQELPRITSTNSPQKVSANQTATLTCQSSGDPTPNLSWLAPLSNQIINTSTNEHTVVGDSLRIKSVNVKKHFGQWTCRACNDLGCANGTVLLDVIGRPSITVSETQAYGNVLLITCQAVGSPKPTLKYYEDDIEISGRTIPGHEVHSNGTLIIHNPARTAKYKCQAVNVNGVEKRNFSVPTVPSAPSKPVVSNVESQSVTLSWTHGKDNGSPIIANYVGIVKVNSSAKVKVKVQRSPEKMSGLTPYTWYTFEVQSENGVGVGPVGPSSQAVRTLEGAPGKPENVVPSYGKDSLTLSWVAPKELNGNPENIHYEISYSVVNSSSATIKVLTNHSQPKRYTIRNLKREPMTTYRFQLRAGNKRIVAWGEPVVFEKSLAKTAPAESPQLSESDVEVLSHDSISLTWKPLDSVYSVEGYVVSYSPDSGRRRKRATQEKRTRTTNATLTGLESGTRYGLQVAGYNKYGVGPYSPRYSVSTNPEPLTLAGGLSLTALICIICACVVFVLLVIILASWLCLRKKKRQKQQVEFMYDRADGGRQFKTKHVKIAKETQRIEQPPSPQRKAPKQAKYVRSPEPSGYHKKNKRASGFYDLTSAVYDNAGFYDPPVEDYYPSSLEKTANKSRTVSINAKDSDVFFTSDDEISSSDGELPVSLTSVTLAKTGQSDPSREPDVVLLSRHPREEEAEDMMEVYHVPVTQTLPAPTPLRGVQSEYELTEIVHDSDRVPYTKTKHPIQETRPGVQHENLKPVNSMPGESLEPLYAEVSAEYLASKRRGKEQQKKVLKKAEQEWEKRRLSTSPRPPPRRQYKKKYQQPYSTIASVSSHKIPDSRISSDQEDSDYSTIRVSSFHHYPEEADRVTAAMF